MQIDVPQGFQLSGVHCGIKDDPNKEDLCLVVSRSPAVAAGVYTQNIVRAASVVRNQALTPMTDARVVVVNSGNANACTGQRGMDDAQEMGRMAAEACGAEPGQALVMSTGIIGQWLPMDCIRDGIAKASDNLAADEAALMAAARGMITTDKGTKIATRAVATSSGNCTITGMAKGAGMIGPRMATMLCVVMTDAALDADTAQRVLTQAVDVSFNSISVEGHMSTSDTVLLLASGASIANPIDGSDLARFEQELASLCIELARMIPDDGEGASHLISIEVQGCKSRADAHQIGKTIAASPLVKTGIAGADPNWGRIVCAAGYSGVNFDPDGMSLSINGIPVFANGAPMEFDEMRASDSIKSQRETLLRLELSEGDASATFWTSDLTVDYVRFNSEYHT